MNGVIIDYIVTNFQIQKNSLLAVADPGGADCAFCTILPLPASFALRSEGLPPKPTCVTPPSAELVSYFNKVVATTCESRVLMQPWGR